MKFIFIHGFRVAFHVSFSSGVGGLEGSRWFLFGGEGLMASKSSSFIRKRHEHREVTAWFLTTFYP